LRGDGLYVDDDGGMGDMAVGAADAEGRFEAAMRALGSKLKHG
jgi:hypothetical protein